MTLEATRSLRDTAAVTSQILTRLTKTAPTFLASTERLARHTVSPFPQKKVDVSTKNPKHK